VTPDLWAGAVAVEDGQILLVRGWSPHDGGRWSVPAAQVAPGEPLVAAVVRAVEEAAGLEAVCDGLLGHVELLGGDVHRVLLAFGATVLSDAAPQGTGTWVGLEEVTDRPLADGLPELLADHGILRLIV
jgi:ADP-ribose pyrophosphatase YjhB (NUDIX family)